MRKLESKNVCNHTRDSIKRADIVLIASCMFVAVILSVFFMIWRGTGSVAAISCDGTEIYRIELDKAENTGQVQYYLVLFEKQDTQGSDIHIMHSEQYPELPVGRSFNLLSVSEGTVRMEAADCRDQICVHHRPVSAKGENIICLPHRLAIGIYDDGNKAMTEKGEDGRTDSPDEPLDGMVR